jgi:dihydropyrimidinase
MSVTAVVGGTVVTPSGLVEADLIIDDGKIAAIEERSPLGSSTAGSMAKQDAVDASGCLVIPGGVDPHCHLMEDVHAATGSAALGGTTTVFSFTNPEAGESAVESFLRCREQVASDGAVVDVGLHAMLYEPDSVVPGELERLQQVGASGVKLFLAYRELGIEWSTRGLFDLMTEAQRIGQIVQVHCENGPLIDALIDQKVASGSRGVRYFAETRPPEIEAEAVSRTLAVASMTGATCYLVHLSSFEAMDFVRLARRRSGSPVLAETCVHYLVLTDDMYSCHDAERYLVAPPLRSQQHQEALWEAIGDGTLDTVGSDHCQIRSLALHELSPGGKGYRYGLAGVGARLPVLLSEGLARGLSIERLVEVACAAPARAFGQFPSKGALAAGSDADIVVYDPHSHSELAVTTFDDRTGDSVYSGKTISGGVRSVVLRGRLLVDRGDLVEEEAVGRYLPAPRSGDRPLHELTQAGVDS